MAVSVKSAREIELMRESCRLLEIVHDELGKMIRPGISTLDIDRKGDEMIREMGCIPNFKNYNGYPASICVSVNDEVVHGIPSRDRILMDGDIVSLDAGLIYKGYHSDAARTHAVGEMQGRARISMISPMRSMVISVSSDTGSSEILWGTASEPPCMKIHRFQTSGKEEKGSGWCPE